MLGGRSACDSAIRLVGENLSWLTPTMSCVRRE
jgi:hypothetical protein